MKVYEVLPVGDKFKALDVDATGYATDAAYDAAFDLLKFRGKSRKPWRAPKMHFRNPLKPDPDFWMLLVSCEAFAAGPEALKVVYSFLEMAGEMLPLSIDGKKLTICNVLQVYDCVDKKQSTWDAPPNDEYRVLVNPVFVPAHMQISSLFKIPERPFNIYCWEVDRDPETEFKACVEQNKLKGLKFELVWTDEKKQ